MDIKTIKANQPMTEAEVLELHRDGFPVLFGEYRTGKAEDIQWRDKATKQMLTGKSVRHTLENAVESVVLSENVEDSFDCSKFVPPAKKGERVAYIIRGMQVTKGVTQYRGTVHPLATVVKSAAK